MFSKSVKIRKYHTSTKGIVNCTKQFCRKKRATQKSVHLATTKAKTASSIFENDETSQRKRSQNGEGRQQFAWMVILPAWSAGKEGSWIVAVPYDEDLTIDPVLFKNIY